MPRTLQWTSSSSSLDNVFPLASRAEPRFWSSSRARAELLYSLNEPSSDRHYSPKLGSYTCLHTWHSNPLGNSCYTCTPNIWHIIECKCNLAEFHAMYTNTSSMKFLSKTCHTSSCYVWSCSVLLVSLLARLQPNDLFLMP